MATEQLVDVDALASWMDRGGLAPGLPLEVERITTGHSNELFSVRRGDFTCALRRPPAGAHPRAHDMVREHRVLSAVHGAGIPVARPLAVCDDPDVIGAPFFLMELVDGVVARHGVPAPLDEVGAGPSIAFAMVDTLADVHALDWRARGLEGFGKPAGFLDRQVGRWSSQLDRYRVRPLPDLEEAGRWLAAHVPSDRPPTLLHGDFTIVNVMLAPSPPLRIVAVVDWELSTIGDPLVDVGWFLGLWHDAGEDLLEGAEAGVMGLPGVDGMPTRASLAERYAARTGSDLRHLGWYCALAMFKLGCIMEGSYARFREGSSEDPYFAALETSVPQLGRRALQFAGGEEPA